MLRVGRSGIVTFPNFGYWKNRLHVLRGRMPVTRRLPYQWYDTPNLRCATISDFSELADEVGGIEVGRLGPAFECDAAVAGVDGDDEARCGLGDVRGW